MVVVEWGMGQIHVEHRSRSLVYISLLEFMFVFTLMVLMLVVSVLVLSIMQCCW